VLPDQFAGAFGIEIDVGANAFERRGAGGGARQLFSQPGDAVVVVRAAETDHAQPFAETGRREELGLLVARHALDGAHEDASAEFLAEIFERPATLLFAAAQERV